MISLVLAQLRVRWGQALALLILSAAVTATAASVPLYADAVDRSVIATELAASSGNDQLASVPAISAEGTDERGALTGHIETLALLPDFDPVFTRQIRVLGLREGEPRRELHRMVARDGFCGQVDFSSGRCPVDGREAALPQPLADEAGLGAGDQVVLTPALVDDRGALEETGPPVAITITGVFTASDPADPYWSAGRHPLGFSGVDIAIFTTPAGLSAVAREPHGELLHFDAVLPASAVTPERLPEIRRQLVEAGQFLGTTVGGFGLNTGVPELLDRISAHGNQARALLPVAAAPLVAIGWLVTYLAVSHGVFTRRRELAVVALRGTSRRIRTVAVVAESLVPVLVGVPFGIAAAHLVVALAPAAATGLDVSNQVLAGAGLAAAGTVLAVLMALRREVAMPVAQLLRQVPPRRRAAVVAGELLVLGLAVALLADLRLFDRELTGVMVAAPAALMLAVALLAARLVRPLVDLAGRWSLRRGRLGTALAALYLARRPGAARLVTVLGLVLGMAGFAVASGEVAAQGRVADAGQAVGADRVLSVQSVDRSDLLAAVRAADPEGRYAMAVTEAGGGNGPPALAVDSTRLAAVAHWSDQYGSVGPDQVADTLRPPGRDPALVADGELAAELRLQEFPDQGEVTLSFTLLPVNGAEPVIPEFGPLVRGEQETYRADVTGCAQGCRLAAVAFEVTGADGSSGRSRVEFTLAGLEQDGVEVLGPEWLTDAGRWREPAGVSDPPSTTAPGEGLIIVHRGAQPQTAYPLLAVTAPYPLPVVTAGVEVPAGLLNSVDNEPVGVGSPAQVAGLPGLPDGGALIDLEYAERYSLLPGPARSPQVWLAADTPDKVVERLAAEGLTIVAQRDADSALAELEQGGAPLALRYFPLAAVVAVAVGGLALALVMAVDRPGWRHTLHQLRSQGMGRRSTARAVRWSYGFVVLAGAAVGLLAAGAAWLATRDRLPLGVASGLLPDWPQWVPVLVPWLAAVVVLVAAAAVFAAGKGETEVRAWDSR